MNNEMKAKTLIDASSIKKMAPGFVALLVSEVEDERDGIMITGPQRFKRPRTGIVIATGGLDEHCCGFMWDIGDEVVMPVIGMQDFYAKIDGVDRLIKFVHSRRIIAAV